MKRIFLFMLFLLSTVAFSETLDKITYKNGAFRATLKERKKVDVRARFNTASSTLELELPNVRLNSNISNTINVDDNFINSIYVNDYGNATVISFEVKPNVSYRIFNRVKEIGADFSGGSSSSSVIQPTQPKTEKTPTSNSDYQSSTSQQSTKRSNRKYTIVVDAGHGGKDAGAIGNGYKEKDIALAVSKKLATNLKKDFNVILTRDSDYFVELAERARIGNRANADFFVSIHLNSAGTSSSNGAEVFYYSKKGTTPYATEVANLENRAGGQTDEPISDFIINDIFYRINQQKSSAVANDVLNGIVSNFGLRKRGVFGANFAVLRGSNSPSILIELGFISNYGDVSNYATNSGQERVAESIANAIRKHFK